VSKELHEKIVTSLCVSSFFGLTLFFFGPVHLYFTNILEFSSSFSEIYYYFIAAAVLCILLLTSFLVCLKSSVHQKTVLVIFILSFLLWFQGNILVWDSGLLDGKEIRWDAYFVYGLVGTGIWAFLFLIGFLLASKLRKVVRGASLAFLLIQLISTSIVVTKAPDASHLHKESQADEDSVFEFSLEKNVIILVLDQFQGDIFQEIINEDPDLEKLFDGFTYYRNALGGYRTTYLTVPLILTGRYYENSVPIQEFIKNVFSADSIPGILTRNGYQVDLIGGNKNVYADKSIASSWFDIPHLIEQDVKLKETAFILDVTLFRYLPYFTKRYVYNNQSWFFSKFLQQRSSGGFSSSYHRDHIEFLKLLARKARGENKRNTFKYVHSIVSHLPVRIDEYLKYVELEPTRANHKKQLKGSLRLVSAFLEALKKIGIYENTMILILSDHGNSYDVDVESLGYRESGVSKIPMIDRFKGQAIPLFLVKSFSSKGNLQISDAPVSLSDVAQTIITELGLQAEIPGRSILEIKKSEIRNRRFFYHEWGTQYMWKAYLAALDEYVVSGFSWLDESWHPTYKRFTPEGVIYKFPHPYQYGTSIEFGKDGNYFKYQGTGWSCPEDGFTWTDGKRATLIIPIERTTSNLELKATFKPLIAPGKLEKQRVRILTGDGWNLGEWVAAGDKLQERALLIHHSRVTGDTTEIVLDLPDAASPSNLGIGEDLRALGIALHSIVLKEVPDGSEM